MGKGHVKAQRRPGVLPVDPTSAHWSRRPASHLPPSRRAEMGWLCSEPQGLQQMVPTLASPVASPEIQLSSALSGYSHHRWPEWRREKIVQ